MLTSNVKNYASIEFITQKKPHKVVIHDMVMFPAVFDLCLPFIEFTFNQITEVDVLNIIDKLPSKASSGGDGLSPILLKHIKKRNN